MPATAASPVASAPSKKAAATPEKKYKCTFCSRAFSRSEHRSRHERSHTKERPFKCMKCKSTFVRRDLLLRHDRTVHAKDGGVPLVSEVKRRAGAKPAAATSGSSKKRSMALDTATLEQIEASSDGMIDLETAAMLMTDIHHKATATAMSNHDDDASTPYSPDHTTMFDNAAPYLSNAVPLPQMPWDHFMSHSVNPAHSISSSLSGSQDSQLSQLSFTSASTIHPNANQHSSMMDHYPSAGDALAPALQSMNNSMPVSGSATPNGRGLSPFPFMLGPVSPVDYRRSPGPSQALTSPKAPQIFSDEEYQIILNKFQAYDGVQSLRPSLNLQSRADVNSFLSSYFNLFHHHLPFLHPESFKPTEVSPPLLLAVLSIGALYTLNHEQAWKLHNESKSLVTELVYNKEDFSSRKCPLWAMQSTLLHMVFASWSGDATGVEWACSIRGLLANNVAGNQYELKLRAEARDGEPPTHAEWIEDEGCRRTYYAVYIFFGMLTLTYNYTPNIGLNEFADLDLPSSESLWNLEISDEEAWRENFASSIVITAREAHGNLFQGEAARYSAFATRVMINVLFLEVWNHQRNFQALQDVVTEYKLRLALDAWEASLDMCEPETIIVQLSAPHKGHPLIFNAMAVYRNTRARLEVDLKSIQEALRYHNCYEVAAVMLRARDSVRRSQEMIKVIEQCFECIEIVALEGIKSVGRTCATNWSVEHPLCGLDLIVILSLWLYRLEHDEEAATEEEIAMYNRIRNLFDDDSVDLYSSKLSSTVAQLWGNMLNDVVVWGITKTMGETFDSLAQGLAGDQETDTSRRSSASTPSMSSRATQGLELQTAVY